MQKTELVSIIKHSTDFSELDRQDIDVLQKRYPYCSTLHLIQCKLAFDKEELGIENQLRRTAAYALNRKRLHELLFTTESLESNNSEITETVHKTEATIDVKTEEQTDEIITSQESIGHDNLLEQQILTSAIHNSISLEVEDTIDYEGLNVLQSAPNRINEDKTAEDQSQSFGAWIKMFGGEIDEHEEINELLENRLPQRQEFYNAAKMARLSVQENDDLVTETLANIYADQDNHEKAIKAFEKLQLKYPEKRIYFAGRIKEIQIQQKKQ